ncbi:unnamed protein product [Prunus armeniaca]
MGASQCIPRLAGEKMYQVNHMYGGEFVVYLKAMSCSCRRWDLCGIPCAHAISTIFHIDEKPVEYVHECYKPETYMRSYEPIVHPIPSMDQWVKGGLPPIRPPFHKRQLGRPKRVRTRVPGEVQVLAPNPPNLLPPDVEHVEKKATIEEDAEAAQNGNVGQNQVQAADNGNACQNDNAPTQTHATPAQTYTALAQTYAAPTQTYTAPSQIQVNRARGTCIERGRGIWNPAAKVSSLKPVVSGISQEMVNPPMTYSQQVPLQPSSSSLTQETTPHRGKVKHSVKR